ncbi:hypothetical protein ACMHYO_16165 [Allopusillimonas ginsengisoli]|uniref:hypothetical protein n=1 Tax=Allopusillimonas ginsengisoli TaxID=453575 RepID=UPI0039C3BA29
MTLESLIFESVASSELVQLQRPVVEIGQPTSPTGKINICMLALDLGTKAGYAIRRRDGTIIHGTQAFTPRASWSPGQRWQRYRSWLVELIVANQVHAIAYEDVKRHVGTDAAHVYGAFRAILEMVADAHNLQLHAVGVGTIKKSWTGWGDASKQAMLAEARRRGFRPDSDNAADALAILDWAVSMESGGMVRLGDGSLPDPQSVSRTRRAAKGSGQHGLAQGAA